VTVLARLLARAGSAANPLKFILTKHVILGPLSYREQPLMKEEDIQFWVEMAYWDAKRKQEESGICSAWPGLVSGVLVLGKKNSKCKYHLFFWVDVITIYITNIGSVSRLSWFWFSSETKHMENTKGSRQKPMSFEIFIYSKVALNSSIPCEKWKNTLRSTTPTVEGGL
jgi:hypothetical protein